MTIFVSSSVHPFIFLIVIPFYLNWVTAAAVCSAIFFLSSPQSFFFFIDKWKTFPSIKEKKEFSTRPIDVLIYIRYKQLFKSIFTCFYFKITSHLFITSFFFFIQIPNNCNIYTKYFSFFFLPLVTSVYFCFFFFSWYKNENNSAYLEL